MAIRTIMGRASGTATIWIGCAAFALASMATSAALAEGLPAVAAYLTQAKAGQGEPRARARILGGIGVTQSQPRAYQVALASSADLTEEEESQFQAQFCGGSLINQRFVLTAAHCLVSEDEEGARSFMSSEEITVLAGDIDLRTAKRHEVANVIVHPDYNPVTFYSDIALIELAEPLQGQIIALADAVFEERHAHPGVTAVVSGWGKLDSGEFPYDLREADLTIQSEQTCAQGLITLYSKQFSELLQSAASRLSVSEDVAQQAFNTIVQSAGNPMTPSVVCAGTPTGVRDSCSGDSGGPLVVQAPDGKPVQVGIVSSGEIPLSSDTPCGHEQLYGYYTKVSDYRDWIAANVAN